MKALQARQLETLFANITERVLIAISSLTYPATHNHFATQAEITHCLIQASGFADSIPAETRKELAGRVSSTLTQLSKLKTIYISPTKVVSSVYARKALQWGYTRNPLAFQQCVRKAELEQKSRARTQGTQAVESEMSDLVERLKKELLEKTEYVQLCEDTNTQLMAENMRLKDQLYRELTNMRAEIAALKSS